ncbi:MAG: hypothetical protein ACKO2V_24860 [Snowella sp.]
MANWDAPEYYFHPLRSEKYWQGKGYPFGRNVYLSELYQLLDNLSGVDYVKELIINPKEQSETVVPEIREHHKKNDPMVMGV